MNPPFAGLPHSSSDWTVSSGIATGLPSNSSSATWIVATACAGGGGSGSASGPPGPAVPFCCGRAGLMRDTMVMPNPPTFSPNASAANAASPGPRRAQGGTTTATRKATFLAVCPPRVGADLTGWRLYSDSNGSGALEVHYLGGEGTNAWLAEVAAARGCGGRWRTTWARCGW